MVSVPFGRRRLGRDPCRGGVDRGAGGLELLLDALGDNQELDSIEHDVARKLKSPRPAYPSSEVRLGRGGIRLQLVGRLQRPENMLGTTPGACEVPVPAIETRSE